MPLSGAALEARLQEQGYELSERTIRGKLLLDEQRLIHKVGYMSARIDQMTYTMDFDLPRRKGTVVINLALVNRDDFICYLPQIELGF